MFAACLLIEQFPAAQAIFVTDNDIRRANEHFVWRSGHVKGGPRVAILLMTCHRTEMLVAAISMIVNIRHNTRLRLKNLVAEEYLQLPLVVSHDCGYRNSFERVQSLISLKQEDYDNDDGIFSAIHNPHWNIPFPLVKKHLVAYYRIAKHYRWAIDQMFTNFVQLEHVIILEDDLVFSKDIFEYFLTFRGLYEQDTSLYCISAWNDNGKAGLIDPNAAGLVYRTDFFPGLGWMLRRSIWNELRSTWPLAFWDDWMRMPEQRRGRQCLRPEISRTQTIGAKGASHGQFYLVHLQYIKCFEGYYNFYANLQHYHQQFEAINYEKEFLWQVYNQSIEKINCYQAIESSAHSFRITYHTRRQLKNITAKFGLMSDIKYGVTRTSYRGIIAFFYNSMRIFLAPPHFTMYFSSWN